MDELVLEIVGAVIGAQNDFDLALCVAQLRLDGNGALAGEIGVLVLQQWAQNIFHRVGVSTQEAHNDSGKERKTGLSQKMEPLP